MHFLNNLLIIATLTSYEDSSEAIQLLSKYCPVISKAAQLYEIKPRTLALIIYTERRLNYNQFDDLFDVPLARNGFNKSIGLSQIRLNTAFWIEKNLNDFTSSYYLGAKIAKHFSPSHDRNKLIAKLVDPSTNIHYAAVYLAMLQKRWKDAGFDISNKPEILATLYSVGTYKPDGSERLPNDKPCANYFGELMVRFFESDLLIHLFPKK